MFEIEQALLRLSVNDDLAGGENMPDIDPGSGQSTPDKQTSVAVERVDFGAHRRHTVSLRQSDQPRQFCAKLGRRSHLLVIRPALSIHLLTCGPSAELPAGIVDALLASEAARAFLLKCGEKRETGAERTSATAVTCALSNNDRNRSRECRE